MKKEYENKFKLEARIAKELSQFIRDNLSVFQEYEKVIVYYDNGQIELSAILNAVFSVHFGNVEFRKAEPQKYRLLQIADFICSVELLKIKMQEKRLSKSEEKFFYNSMFNDFVVNWMH
mgnify:CR=1 FL=1